MTGWHNRFFHSTRGKVLALLRGAARTVSEISGILGLTQNAVRVQLAALERDGLVRQQGVRAGARKPHHSYEITEEADTLFPKAYSPILSELLVVLSTRLPEETMNDILDEVGRRLAEAHFGDVPDDLQNRLKEVLVFLNGIGGCTTLEGKDGEYVIQGSGCPIAETVKTHPVACRAVRSMLAAATGVEVEEECHKGQRPNCRFKLCPKT